MSAVKLPSAFVPRYNATERSTHWLLALCFVLATLSGLALFHPAFWFLTVFLGGGVWSRILHPWVGTLMVLAFVPMALWYWRDNLIRDYDIAWMKRLKDQLFNAADMPDIDKYNAGQKMLFWSIIASLLGLLASGAVLWLHPDPRVSIPMVRLSGVVHVLCAFVLFMGMLVHIYSAVLWIRGSMRAMVRGEVKAGWAKHHHALWYRRVTGQKLPK
jgi:formate dehydrogenase subunit gamma